MNSIMDMMYFICNFECLCTAMSLSFQSKTKNLQKTFGRFLGKKCKKIFQNESFKISKFFSFGAKNKNFLGQKKRIQNFGEKRGKNWKKKLKNLGKSFFFWKTMKKHFVLTTFNAPPRKGEGPQMETQVQFAARYVITPLKSPGCGVQSVKLLAAN